MSLSTELCRANNTHSVIILIEVNARAESCVLFKHIDNLSRRECKIQQVFRPKTKLEMKHFKANDIVFHY
jgi:hypothetical protein